jgi:hypothetical protein
VSLSHHLEGLHPGPELSGLLRPVGTPNVVEADVFPPLRAHAPDTNMFLPYITEDIAFEEEYEEYLSDLGWSDGPSHTHAGEGQSGGTSRWHRLPDLASEIADGISDSESIESIGELGDESRDIGREGGEIADENLNNWEVKNEGFFSLFIRHTEWILAYEPEDHGCTDEVASGARCTAFVRIR